MISEIITRLSKLDAPDREVDGLIAETFGFPQEVFGDSFGTDDVDGPEMHYDAATWSGNGKSWSAPFFTASVDAAIALAERIFPGCDIETSDVHADFRGPQEPRHIADLSSDLVWEKYEGYPEPVYRVRGTGQSNIRAIALLIALLRAKEASHDQ